MKWQDISVDMKTMSTGGCLPLPQGYIHVLNHERKCIKLDFKEIFLELATNKWTVRPCPEAIYMYKVMKKIV